MILLKLPAVSYDSELIPATTCHSTPRPLNGTAKTFVVTVLSFNRGCQCDSEYLDWQIKPLGPRKQNASWSRASRGKKRPGDSDVRQGEPLDLVDNPTESGYASLGMASPSSSCGRQQNSDAQAHPRKKKIAVPAAASESPGFKKLEVRDRPHSESIPLTVSDCLAI
jgi:hypothetical protein